MKSNCFENKSIEKVEEALNFLKVVSEKNRFKILCFLKESERCVCEIERHLKLPQNLVSHHLKVLKKINLVLLREEGTKNFYKINKKVVKKYLDLLNKLLK